MRRKRGDFDLAISFVAVVFQQEEGADASLMQLTGIAAKWFHSCKAPINSGEWLTICLNTVAQTKIKSCPPFSRAAVAVCATWYFR